MAARGAAGQVNPIGAGDTCAAALLFALDAGRPPAEAFAFALAAASASCAALAGADFSPAALPALSSPMPGALRRVPSAAPAAAERSPRGQ